VPAAYTVAVGASPGKTVNVRVAVEVATATAVAVTVTAAIAGDGPKVAE
jgi:hypothetical protein